MKKKILVLGLVGCLTLGSASFASNVKDINTKSKLANPVSISKETKENKIKIETKTIKLDIDNVEADINIPVIKGLEDKVYEEQLNYKIKSSAEKDITEFKKNIKGVKNPEIKIGYEVKSEGDILSFIIDHYFYTGGANGILRRDCYNINTKENRNIELADLFKKDRDYKTIINNEIKEQIKEEIATGEKSYFEDGFKTIKETQPFYIDKDGNLVIFFQVYDIAPRYMGYPEFKIPEASIVHILKDAKPIIIKDKYYNEKYSFEFKIAPIWKNKVTVEEDYDLKNRNLDVNFIYSPANKKVEGEKIFTISVVDKKDYKKDKKSFIIEETKDYIYLGTVPQSNPYDINKPEGKEYAKLLRVLDGVDDLFTLTEIKGIKTLEKVIINGKEVELKRPMIKSEEGTIMIPLVEIAKALDFKVKWDGKNKIANINKDNVSAGAYIGENRYYFSRAFVYLEEEAKIIKGKTFVPISFIDKVLQGEKFVNTEGVLNIKY